MTIFYVLVSLFAEDLEQQAKGFQVVTKKVKEQQRWKYRKVSKYIELLHFIIHF